MTVLETVFEREQQAKKVKESGIVDFDDKQSDNKLTTIHSYSENVAWSYEEDREEAKQRFNSLQKDTGYKINY